MRRRRYLAALGTAASAGLAGCGYAPGGGDSRGTASVHPGGLGGDPMYAVDASGIVGARSGRVTVFEDGDVEFTDGTELLRASRAGTERWRHVYRAESAAVALGAAVYLLDAEGRVAALAGRRTRREKLRDAAVEPTRLWRTVVAGARPPLAVSGTTAYVATDDGVAAVRDGAVAWRTSLPAVPTALLPTTWGVVASGSGTVVALDSEGTRRWTADGEALATTDDRVYLQTSAGSLAADTTDGSRLWTVETPGTITGVAATPENVVVAGGSSLSAFTAEGRERWRASGVDSTEVVVPAPEGAYVATHTVVEAVGPGGRRWERSIENMGSPVAGWLAGQRVASLFDSGTVQWFQRTDQRRGLLSGHR